MAIPDYQTILLPLLRTIADGQEHRIRDLYQALAAEFQLTPGDIETLLPSGQQPVFHNRIGWAKTYLKAAGLLSNPVRGKVRITDAGKQLLATNPVTLTKDILEQYPSFNEFFSKSEAATEREVAEPSALNEQHRTPLELLNDSFGTLQEATKAELLARLKTSAPSFFEKAVVKLLIAMGYGGVGGSGKVTGHSGDGGIDGTIAEDKLGLDVICIQAKRYESASVGRPAVQAFVGSMDFVRSKKGVMLTTSEFTRDAREFVERIEGKKVVLIDGNTLADLMLAHNVGVTTSNLYELKEVSQDFFDEDEA